MRGEGDRATSSARWALHSEGWAGGRQPGPHHGGHRCVTDRRSRPGLGRAWRIWIPILLASRGIHADGLFYRGALHLLAGDLQLAIADLTTSLQLFRKGAPLTVSLHTYSYLVLAQYLSGAWDDALLTAEQGLLEAAVHPRPV